MDKPLKEETSAELVVRRKEETLALRALDEKAEAALLSFADVICRGSAYVSCGWSVEEEIRLLIEMARDPEMKANARIGAIKLLNELAARAAQQQGYVAELVERKATTGLDGERVFTTSRTAKIVSTLRQLPQSVNEETPNATEKSEEKEESQEDIQVETEDSGVLSRGSDSSDEPASSRVSKLPGTHKPPASFKTPAAKFADGNTADSKESATSS